MLAPREIDEYLLPTERRVIRVRMHWAVMANNLILTGLFLLLMIIAQRYLPTSALVDNLTFYLALASVVRFTVQTILWWTTCYHLWHPKDPSVPAGRTGGDNYHYLRRGFHLGFDRHADARIEQHPDA